MEIQISEDLKQFIESQVSAGRYPTERDVVEAALRRMREQERTGLTPESGSIDEKRDQVNPPVRSPNVTALAILKAVRHGQAGRSVSDSIRTQEYLREARSGGMYGNGDVARNATVEHHD